MPVLPQLRFDLDFMPSPLEDRPGLLIRDTFRFSDTTLILPPPLVPLLRFFDGKHEERELHHGLFELTGEVDVGPLTQHLVESLDHAGFLINERFLGLREAKMEAFRQLPDRQPAHAGGGYPEEAGALRGMMERYLNPDGVPGGETARVGIAAPHASPDASWESYREAYLGLPAEAGERTFVILGTSHYGAPERFGLTRKNYVTPFGAARTDQEAVEFLARRVPGAVEMEDYCHSIEHSIEFQTVFLQAVYGPEVKVLPVLCGPFGRSLYQGGMPEEDEGVAAFLEALREWRAGPGREAYWVLGVDMAHVGRRYGDEEGVQAGDEQMARVEERDRARLAAIERGDAEGYWGLVQPDHDDLRWCGSAPIYTFLRTAPEVRAELKRYQQWNIDGESVVSFAALHFG
jgi:AmmeMemoRadiSam system protein B